MGGNGQKSALHETLGGVSQKNCIHICGVKHGRVYMDFRFGFLFFSVAMTVVAFWYMTPCNMLLNSDIAEESAPLHC